MPRHFTAALLALSLLAAPAAQASQATLVTPAAPLPMTSLATFLNAAHQSLGSCNSGASAPTNGPGAAAFAGQCWINTTANPWIFNYTSDGTNWSQFGALDTSTHAWTSGTTTSGWTSYTPTLSCGSGTLTTATGAGSYAILPNKTVAINIHVAISSLGTCASSLFTTLPFNAVTSPEQALTGANNNNIQIQGRITGANQVQWLTATGTFPIPGGTTAGEVQGVYQIQ